MKNRTFRIGNIGVDRALLISSFVFRLLQEDWSDVFKPQSVRSYQQIFSAAYFTEALRKDHTALGAFVKEELIGIYILKKEFGGVGFVDWLGVDKRFRRQGVASELLRLGDQLALSLKLHFLYLYTERKSNISFYENRGFKLIGTLNNAWFGEDECVLAKQLKDQPFAEVYKKVGR